MYVWMYVRTDGWTRSRKPKQGRPLLGPAIIAVSRTSKNNINVENISGVTSKNNINVENNSGVTSTNNINVENKSGVTSINNNIVEIDNCGTLDNEELVLIC